MLVKLQSDQLIALSVMLLVWLLVSFALSPHIVLETDKVAFWRFGFVEIIYVVWLWSGLWNRIIVLGSFTGTRKPSIVMRLLEYFFNYFLWDIYICNFYLLIIPAVWGTPYLFSASCWAWVLSLYHRNFTFSCCLCWDSVRFCKELAMHSNPYLWFPVWLTDHPVHRASLQLRTQSWPQAWSSSRCKAVSFHEENTIFEHNKTFWK